MSILLKTSVFRNNRFSENPSLSEWLMRFSCYFSPDKRGLSNGAVSRTRDFSPTKSVVLEVPRSGCLKIPSPSPRVCTEEWTLARWRHNQIFSVWCFSQMFIHRASLARLARWCSAIVTNSTDGVSSGLVNMVNSHLMTLLCNRL